MYIYIIIAALSKGYAAPLEENKGGQLEESKENRLEEQRTFHLPGKGSIEEEQND